jgi:putative NADH-flavin reductase
MKLTIFGASGGVGRELVQQAVDAGHEVLAVVRSNATTPFDPRAERRVADDLRDTAGVADAVRGADAVLSAVGLRRRNPNNPWSKIVSPTDLTSRFAQSLVEVLPRESPSARVIVVSAAGVGDSRPKMSGVLRWMFDHSNVGVAYLDLDRMEMVLRSSSLDWMAVRPVTLTNGRRSGQVRIKQTYGLMDKISRADVAGYMLGVLNRPLDSERTPIIAGR